MIYSIIVKERGRYRILRRTQNSLNEYKLSYLGPINKIFLYKSIKNEGNEFLDEIAIQLKSVKANILNRETDQDIDSMLSDFP